MADLWDYLKEPGTIVLLVGGALVLAILATSYLPATVQAEPSSVTTQFLQQSRGVYF